MAEELTKKMIDQLLDENNNDVFVSADIIVDKASGKTLAEHVADPAAHKSDDDINALINANVESLRTAVNTFLSGEPDDNGTMDRLKELVTAINDNKGAIDDLLNGNFASGGGSIDIAASASDTPTWDGKLRLIVTDYTPPAAQA